MPGVRRGLAVALITFLFAAGAAWADGTISARPVPQNTFSESVTTIDQGEKVTFQNMDLAAHNVVAKDTGDDGKALFRSEEVPGGSSGPVVGTEYLVTGTYPFQCTLHPGMEATLEVTSAGTPVPRPQPSVTLKIASSDLDTVVERGKLKLRVKSAKATLTIGARSEAGKKTIALGSKKVEWDGGKGRVRLKLSDSAREALGKRKSVTVIATATADHGGGHTERATDSRKLD